tara:strand:- start:120 stop:494 length:375 start_codon:yes stop_codon:yes gene_type:complete
MKTFREYLVSTPYKTIFNEIYKLYLKDKFDDKFVTEHDLSVSSYVEHLKGLPPKLDVSHEIHIVEQDGQPSVHCDHECECAGERDGCLILEDPAKDHIDLNVKTNLDISDAKICALIIEYLSDK